MALPTTADQTATEREAFTVTLPAATEGLPPYGYRATGLPDGLTFDPDTRIISGTPTEFGSFTVTYTASDAAGQTASDTFALAIAQAPTKARDTAGDADLTYRDDTTHRAFDGIDAAVPHGGAPEFTHTSGNGLSGRCPPASVARSPWRGSCGSLPGARGGATCGGPTPTRAPCG